MRDVTPVLMGRPTVYKPEYCEMLIEHMKKGLSFESFGGVIFTSTKTLYNWLDKHEDFLQAKEIGQNLSRLFWESIGIEFIVNKSDGFGPGQFQTRSINANIWCFNMMNRFQWRQKNPEDKKESGPKVLEMNYSRNKKKVEIVD